MANLGGAEQDDERAAERVQASFLALAEACDFQANNPTRHRSTVCDCDSCSPSPPVVNR
jgi:hypothetical protein